MPFASDGGGDTLCVDLAPADGGGAGQVISHHHADSARSLKATSFHAFFRQFAERLEGVAAES